LFVKAPAGTIGDLAQVIELTIKQVPIKIIGTHGEKVYETLCTTRRNGQALKIWVIFQVPADNRDLNYAKYFLGRRRG
jgi:UDP-glucose 4-epimerase